MLQSITLNNGVKIPRKAYAESLAKETGIETNTIYSLMRLCETDGDMEEDAPKEHYDMMERICEDVDRTKGLMSGAVTAKEVILSSPAGDVSSQEAQIVEAARSTSLANGYSKLCEIFDFGPDMTQLKLKWDKIASPADYGAVVGMGMDMATKGVWLVGDSVANLIAMGHESAVQQIAAELKMSYGAVSNWYRTALSVPPQKRMLVTPTVAQEIVCAKYSGDKKENEKKRAELLDEAIRERWNSSEARSHVRMAKGKDEPITDGSEKKKNPALEIDRLHCIIREAYHYLKVNNVKAAMKALKPEIEPF